MLSKWITIQNSIGLHARPVSQLAAAAGQYQANIRLRYGDFMADVKNSARILSLGINAGEMVELIVDGSDEATAFKTLNVVFDEINQQ